MSETLQELADVPKDFLRDGTQFLNRCTKRMYTGKSNPDILLHLFHPKPPPPPIPHEHFEQSVSRKPRANTLHDSLADKREFIKISQAVGFGFLIMGAIGYVIKLSEPSKPPEPQPYTISPGDCLDMYSLLTLTSLQYIYR